MITLPGAGQQPQLGGTREGVGIELGGLLLTLSSPRQNVNRRIGDHHLLDGRLEIKGLRSSEPDAFRKNQGQREEHAVRVEGGSRP